jgi:hypothetical protein
MTELLNYVNYLNHVRRSGQTLAVALRLKCLAPD